MQHVKKKFTRTTLLIDAIHANQEFSLCPPEKTLVRIEPSSITGGATFEFSRWYGCGIDEITFALQEQIERFVAGQDAELSKVTIVAYCTLGIATFLEYVAFISATKEIPVRLADVTRDLIDGYLLYLQASGLSTPSQKAKYDKAKAVLKALGRRDRLQIVHVGDFATFPPSPFPGAGNKVKGETPLTREERKQFALAINEALSPIFSSETVTLTSELVSYAALAVALYTGRNTTPILQMPTTCLKPHPKEGTMFLLLYKRRGNSYSKVALRNDLKSWEMIEGTSTVRWNIVVLIRRVLELSEPLRQKAPDALKGRLWLFEAAKGPRVGQASALEDATFGRNVAALVKGAQLVDGGGKPLRINISRLRKTFVNRLNELLNGDIGATAYAAGHSPSVTTNSYLRPGENSKRNWRFMGETLVTELLTNNVGKTAKTPVGQCTDGRHGEFAPKKADGAVCMSFLNCLRCANYVVTGDDLHRLFSFYWRVLGERAHIERQRWDRQFAHIVRLIERDVIAAGVKKRVFKQAEVDEARERARLNPHPFWRADGMMEALATL
jgi:hypothetical protein